MHVIISQVMRGVSVKCHENWSVSYFITNSREKKKNQTRENGPFDTNESVEWANTLEIEPIRWPIGNKKIKTNEQKKKKKTIPTN